MPGMEGDLGKFCFVFSAFAAAVFVVFLIMIIVSAVSWCSDVSFEIKALKQKRLAARQKAWDKFCEGKKQKKK